MNADERTIWRWLGPVMIVVMAGAMFAASWQKWCDPLVDAGRELYTAWRVGEGDGLYRDLAYFNGPISPHVNALWFKLLGVSIRSLVIGNTLVLAAILTLIYRLFHAIAGHRGATVAGLTFVFVFGFADYEPISNYTYLLPYSHEATHGVLIGLATLWCIGRLLRGGGVKWAIVIGVLTGLAWLMKFEILLATTAAAIAGLALAVRQGGSARGLVSRFIGGLAGVQVASFALLAVLIDVPSAVSGLSGAWTPLLFPEVSNSVFYRWVSGMDQPSRHLVEMLIATTVYIVFTGAVIVAARWWRGRAAAWVIGIVAALLVIAASAVLRLPLLLLTAGWPLDLIIVWVVLVRVSGPGDTRVRLATPMVVFALVMVLKMVLRTQVAHYGFVLAMPAGLMVSVAVTVWLPQWLAKVGADRCVVAGAMVGAWLALSSFYVDGTLRTLGNKTIPLGDGADRVYVLRATTLKELGTTPLVRAWKRADELMPRGATVLVVPEGVMFNYLTRRVNPTGYLNFMPPEMIIFGEQGMIDAIDRRPPDYVMAIGRSTAEYGLPLFGKDYAQQLWHTLRRRYDVLEVLTDHEPLIDTGFGVMLMKRKGRAAADGGG